MIDLLRIEAAVARFYADADVTPPTAPGIVSVKSLLRELPAQVEVHEIGGFTHAQAADLLLRDWGLSVPVDRADGRRLAGLVYGVRHPPAFVAHICARAEDPVTRRRFTIGHEIGHLYLHFLREGGADAFFEAFDHGGSAGDTSTESGEHAQADSFGVGPDDLPDLDTMEAEANAFSALLLMPETACRTRAHELANTYGDRRAVLARRMASDFLVSKTAMLNRLKTLHIGVEPD